MTLDDEFLEYDRLAGLLSEPSVMPSPQHRVTTACSLLRQALYTMENQGLPRSVVMEVLRFTLRHEEAIDDAKGGG